jgi:hypothetical protein
MTLFIKWAKACFKEDKKVGAHVQLEIKEYVYLVGRVVHVFKRG